MDLRLRAALPSLLLLLSCGSGLVSQAYSLDGGRPGNGRTACGEEVCEPGQYCQDPTYGMCWQGCASDENCARGQKCHHTAADPRGTCGAPGASDGDICTQAGTKCDGNVLVCYYGDVTDTAGTCRLSCSWSFDCGQAGYINYDCCQIAGLSALACVPSTIATGSCQ
ncbi:MAG: hypothetical protein QM765_10475 [Myxococcales bacterium]